MAPKAAAMAVAAVLLLGGFLVWRTAGGGAEVGTADLRDAPGPAAVAGGEVARAPAEAPAGDPPVEEPPVTGPLATGRVVDAAGSPVAGAAVRSWPRDESRLLDPAASEGEGVARALTGADGSFIVPLRGDPVLHDLVATAPGFAPRPFEGVRDGDAVVVVLDRAVRVLGRVLDPEGKPVPGARVTAVISLPGRILARREVESGVSGEFLLDAFGGVPGRTGRAGGATLRVAASGFAPALAEVPFVDAEPGSEVPLDITLYRGAALTVTVGEAESGAPVDGATVAWGTVAVPVPVATENRNTASFEPPAGTLGEATTGPDGRAVFPHAAIGESLSIFVRAWKPGFTAEAAEIRPAGGGPAEARVTLHPAVEVRGRVMDEAGRPIPGATVTPSPAAPDWFPSAMGDRPPHGCATTDADGRYVLPGVRAAAGEGLEVTLEARPSYEGIAGPWTWGAAVRRGPCRVVLRTVPGAPVEAPDLVLPAGEEAPGVRLLVVDAEGRPIPGVSVSGQGTLLRFQATDAGGRVEVRWHTDPSLLGISARGPQRTLRLERRGFGGCTLPVEPAAGDLPEVRATLEPGRSLAGRVEGRYDPTWNTWISVFMGGEERPSFSSSLTLGSDGSFCFEDLPGGPFTVVAGTVHPDTEEEVRVSLGAVEAGREDLLLALPPDPLPRGRVEGRVLDGRTGLVVPVFSVEVVGPSPRSPRTGGGRATGGRFSLPLVPEGDWVARVTARNYLEERVEVRVRAGAVARLDVKLAKGAALKGTARDPGGKPLTTGWMVRLVPREGGDEGWCWVGGGGGGGCPRGPRPPAGDLHRLRNCARTEKARGHGLAARLRGAGRALGRGGDRGPSPPSRRSSDRGDGAPGGTARRRAGRGGGGGGDGEGGARRGPGGGGSAPRGPGRVPPGGAPDFRTAARDVRGDAAALRRDGAGGGDGGAAVTRPQRAFTHAPSSSR